jgi:hypothetical protein
MAGEIGRALGLRVPEIVFMDIDPTLGRNEPDYEIRQLLKALWPDADPELVSNHLEAIRLICEGDPSAGLIAQLSRRERFHWLVAPRSTIIQTSPVHTGVCLITDDLLDRLEKQFLA